MDLSGILSFPKLSGVNVRVFLSKPILIVIFLVYFIFYFILSSILFYHWKAYGMKNPSILVAESVFMVVSLILFVLVGLTISYY